MAAPGYGSRKKGTGGYKAGGGSRAGGMTKEERASLAEEGGTVPAPESSPAYKRAYAEFQQEKNSPNRPPYNQSAQARLESVKQEHSRALSAAREVRSTERLSPTNRARILARYNADSPEGALREIQRRYIAATR